MTDTVRVSREAVEEIADDLRAISLELTKKQATTPVSEDIFRKALALEAMLAASPQGEDGWTKHDGGPNLVPGNNCPVCKGLGEFFWDGGLASKNCRRCDGTGVTEGVKP